MSRPRPRLVRPAKRAPVAPRARARARLAAALARRAAHERDLLALLLVERLTPAEAADALGISARALRRTFAAVMAGLEAELRRATPARPRRPRGRAPEPAELLRRAS